MTTRNVLEMTEMWRNNIKLYLGKGKSDQLPIEIVLEADLELSLHTNLYIVLIIGIPICKQSDLSCKNYRTQLNTQKDTSLVIHTGH